MNAVLIPTNEFSSRRFEDLCEHLDAGTTDQVERTFFHLVTWWMRWAADDETDTGLLWNLSLFRLGQWSKHPNPKAFGNGLLAAGYIKPVEDVYKEPLLRGRSGFVVEGSLDESWNGVHRFREIDAPTLCLYLLDRKRRVSLCARYGVQSNQCPEGWLDPIGDETRVEHVGDTWPPRGEGPPPPLPPRVQVQVNQGNQEKHLQEREQRARTGTRKSPELRRIIEEHKYDDPRQCLHAIDPSQGAASSTWDRAIQANRGMVSQILAEMTDTDGAWHTVPDPPARLVMARILGMLKVHRRHGNKEARGGSGGGGKSLGIPAGVEAKG